MFLFAFIVVYCVCFFFFFVIFVCFLIRETGLSLCMKLFVVATLLFGNMCFFVFFCCIFSACATFFVLAFRFVS